MKYGLDIKTPNTNPGKDGWEPVMENELARKKFDTADEMFACWDAMKAGNATLQIRAVEIFDHDPTYSV